MLLLLLKREMYRGERVCTKSKQSLDAHDKAISLLHSNWDRNCPHRDSSKDRFVAFPFAQ